MAETEEVAGRLVRACRARAAALSAEPGASRACAGPRQLSSGRIQKRPARLQDLPDLPKAQPTASPRKGSPAKKPRYKDVHALLDSAAGGFGADTESERAGSASASDTEDEEAAAEAENTKGKPSSELDVVMPPDKKAAAGSDPDWQPADAVDTFSESEQSANAAEEEQPMQEVAAAEFPVPQQRQLPLSKHMPADPALEEVPVAGGVAEPSAQGQTKPLPAQQGSFEPEQEPAPALKLPEPAQCMPAGGATGAAEQPVQARRGHKRKAAAQDAPEPEQQQQKGRHAGGWPRGQGSAAQRAERHHAAQSPAPLVEARACKGAAQRPAGQRSGHCQATLQRSVERDSTAVAAECALAPAANEKQRVEPTVQGQAPVQDFVLKVMICACHCTHWQETRACVHACMQPMSRS